MKSPILGASYVTRSLHAASNRMVNLYPEIVSEGGKDAAFIARAPGLRTLATVGDGPIKGMWVIGDELFVVSGDALYSVSTAWSASLIGTLLISTDHVSMADNGVQLFIACGTRGYVYNTGTNTLDEIVDVDFPGAVTVGYLDGYFVYNEPDSQSVWVTGLLAGGDIDPLDFASAESLPDALLAIAIDHREVWLFGEQSIEVWYNSGDADFPLSRIQGATLEVGIASPYCVSKLDNSLFWLGSDGIVYRANGYTGQRVSTHAVETWIAINATLDTAKSYSYRQEGHQWYVLSFDGTDTTWVYDVATGLWHERAGWNDGSYTRHRGACAPANVTTFSGEVVVGDFLNGKIYAFDLGVYADDGAVQRWLRSWRALPPGTNNLKRQVHHSLQLDIEAGVGITEGQGSEPEVMLRHSDDGGKTWSNELWRNIGAMGRTGMRAIWRRLGGTEKLRDRVYEVSGTDPVSIVITGAELDVEALDA